MKTFMLAVALVLVMPLVGKACDRCGNPYAIHSFQFAQPQFFSMPSFEFVPQVSFRTITVPEVNLVPVQVNRTFAIQSFQSIQPFPMPNFCSFNSFNSLNSFANFNNSRFDFDRNRNRSLNRESIRVRERRRETIRERSR
jgi:hypothetical protein